MEENQVLNNTEVTSEQTEVTVETQPQDVKTFTQEDLDRIVTKRLEREAKKWEAKFNALEEAQKLSQMNEEQKAEYDYNKKLEELTQREQELEAKINQYNQQQYKATIQAQLQEAGLPVTMADMLVNMDAEAVATQINAMKEMFSTQINAQVQSKVQASANVPTQPVEQVKLLSLDEIKAMSSSEYIANKELVEKSLKALSK
ncbi:DUF4355 domain-containing protein [Turicibacter sp. TJ11]|uniref:DUF4355 domain-containing protein n=1 Tax=Turicibacter sp. TJ11 TaxID=2806443 RepID=UPI001F1EA411|nr:DUF4355 domain-containing protein [Turicibacter sp. TJ11]